MARPKKWTWGDYRDDVVTVDGYLGTEEISFDLCTRHPDREERARAERFAEAIVAQMNDAYGPRGKVETADHHGPVTLDFCRGLMAARDARGPGHRDPWAKALRFLLAEVERLSGKTDKSTDPTQAAGMDNDCG